MQLHTSQRQLPHQIRENIWTWSIFSDEKGLYFNGFALKTADGVIFVDPPSLDEEILASLKALGQPGAVVLTNRDHERQSHEFRKQLGVPVGIHAEDAPLLENRPDFTFDGLGALIRGGLKPIHLPDQKSPGECAIYLPEDLVLILGDALIGKPAGQLSMLPDEKYADPSLAFRGLQILRSIRAPYDAVLVGDGESILEHGSERLTDFFARRG